VCISLAGIWALITGSRIDSEKQPEFKASYLRWTTGWLLPSFLLMPLAMVWYLVMVPTSQRALLTLGISTIGSGTFSQVTRIALIMIVTSATIIAVAYYLAYRNPKDFTLSHALAILLLALMATGSGEYAREMLRKPYVIGQHMYSNGMRVRDVAAANQRGYLEHSLWLDQGADPHWAKGEAMYRGQCGSCHTLTGYRSLDKLLAGRDRESVGNLLDMLHEYKPDMAYRRFMPPLTGTPDEIQALGDYLYAESARASQAPGGQAKMLAKR
jgi:cytochrome d ubiquinol oxidase subunit I